MLYEGVLRMKKKLRLDFDWYDWKTTEKEYEKIDKKFAARLLFDIVTINEFEHALLRLKNDDCVWGPVHSSVGEEAVAAGVTAALRTSDKVFSTHRGHHHFLAKVLQAKIPENWDPFDGSIPGECAEGIVRSMAEIMGLSRGYCGGRGGSMHLRCRDAGFLGSNAIVGGGIPLSTGAAYTEKSNNTGNIVICYFGDGAINQGAFHEAANMASIWDLPVIFLCENNEYAVATSRTEVCSVSDMSIRAAAYGMDGHIVEGSDPVALYNAVTYAAKSMRKGAGPCIIEAKCYRRYHHAGDQPGSAYNYRTTDEETIYFEKEPVKSFPRMVREKGVLAGEEIERVSDTARRAVDGAVEALTNSGEPRTVKVELFPDPATVTDGVRSNGKEFDGITWSEKDDFDKWQNVKYSDAIAAVTRRWIEKEPNTFVMGEEVANFGGGAYGATKGLPAQYPERVRNTPISEAGFAGLGLGAAMTGMRPIVEIMFCDFSLVAADQLFNQIGKARHMYGNTTDIPLVVRTRVCTGLGYGGQHSMNAAGLYALFPGWRIISPSNAFDYIGLFNTAMHSLDPVLILEHQALYTKKFPVPAGNYDYFLPFGKASVVAEGDRVTLLTYGNLVARCESIAHRLAGEGIAAELIDLRTLDYPAVDYETIGLSVKKTGAVMICEEAKKSHALGATLAKEISERFFDYLDCPVASITSADVPPPVSRVLENAALVNDDTLAETAAAVARRTWK
ncbi:MAG: hypothetical protein GF350_12635 [Chitinivibrionales bacterium]|nr:hypothetical protein [Chitinivibrionales bacterium]